MIRSRVGVVGLMLGCGAGVAVAIMFAGGIRDDTAKQGSTPAQKDSQVQPDASQPKWNALFNGQNLDGWTIFPAQSIDIGHVAHTR